jgi:hypothetical protein
MNNQNNKSTWIWIGIILFLLIASFLFGRCSEDPDVVTRTITLKEIVTKSDTIKEFIKTIKKRKDSIRYKDSIIYHDQEFDKEMVERFSKLQNEYDKIKSYISAVEKNTYSIPIETEFYKTVNNIEVQGKLLSFQQDHVLKERAVSMEIPAIKTKFALYAGIGLQSTTELTSISPSANVMFQNKNGSIVGLQYSLDKSIQITYSIKIFDIKR